MKTNDAAVLVTILACIALCLGDMTEEEQPDGTMRMSFKTPKLNLEESESKFMPDDLKCDACYIIAHKVQYTCQIIQ